MNMRRVNIILYKLAKRVAPLLCPPDVNSQKILGRLMPAKKDNATYVAELFSTEYEALEPYILSNTKILHRHKKCGHIWAVSPNNLLTKLKHCPNCAPNSKKSHDYYQNKLVDHEMLEPFIDVGTKILHRHNVCGFEWRVSPHDMEKIVSCPQCAFILSKYLYYVYFPRLDLYKVGITNSIDRRLHEIGEPYRVLFIQEYSSGHEAYNIEQQILKYFKAKLVNTGELKSGNTETFRW